MNRTTSTTRSSANRMPSFSPSRRGHDVGSFSAWARRPHFEKTGARQEGHADGTPLGRTFRAETSGAELHASRIGLSRRYTGPTLKTTYAAIGVLPQRADSGRHRGVCRFPPPAGAGRSARRGNRPPPAWAAAPRPWRPSPSPIRFGASAATIRLVQKSGRRRWCFVNGCSTRSVPALPKPVHATTGNPGGTRQFSMLASRPSRIDRCISNSDTQANCGTDRKARRRHAERCSRYRGNLH